MNTLSSKKLLLSAAKILSIFLLIFSINACSSNHDNNSIIADDTAGLTKIQTLENATHSVELYSSTGSFEQGHNSISLRIKDKTTATYIVPSAINWMPMMHMTNMMHSCPSSELTAVSGKTNLYSGYIVFQMPENATEYWDLTVKYILGGVEYEAAAPIAVPASAQRRVTTLTGADGQKYVLALIVPTTPKVALNDMTVGIFKMTSMTSFPIVDNMKITIDPRMPSMGNHGSPNNVALTQSAVDNLYHGKLSLTMTGYWKINMQLFDVSNTLIGGQAIDGSVENSNLFFEVEF